MLPQKVWTAGVGWAGSAVTIANRVADELPFTAGDVVDCETGVEPRFDEKLGSTPIRYS